MHSWARELIQIRKAIESHSGPAGRKMPSKAGTQESQAAHRVLQPKVRRVKGLKKKLIMMKKLRQEKKTYKEIASVIGCGLTEQDVRYYLKKYRDRDPDPVIWGHSNLVKSWEDGK